MKRKGDEWIGKDGRRYNADLSRSVFVNAEGMCLTYHMPADGDDWDVWNMLWDLSERHISGAYDMKDPRRM